eukprot:5148811-Prymnesium_polylepis.1
MALATSSLTRDRSQPRVFLPMSQRPSVGGGTPRMPSGVHSTQLTPGPSVGGTHRAARSSAKRRAAKWYPPTSPPLMPDWTDPRDPAGGHAHSAKRRAPASAPSCHRALAACALRRMR